jgi:CRISPR type IV-associated protein Csf3
MRPLQITAHLAGSIAISRPEDIALDGILAAQELRRHFGAEFYLLPDPSEHLTFARLPLALKGQPSAAIEQAETGYVVLDKGTGWEEQSLWYWACSRAQIDVRAHETQYWNKRFDVQPALSDHIDFAGRVEKIIIENGRYKAYHMPLPTLVTDTIIWYAYGEAGPIASLLSGVTAIGKKRAYGNGAVVRWQIEEQSQDWSEWRAGQLMRPIPGPLFDQETATPLNLEYIAFRAPQWHPLNQMMCVTAAIRKEVGQC